MRRLIMPLIMTACLLVACASNDSAISIRLNSTLTVSEIRPPSTKAPNTYVFGFDRRLEPKEDVRIYETLLRYLEQRTDYHFLLHITPKGSDLVTDIGQGTVDFAVVGTLAYLQAYERHQAQMLVRGINTDGKSTYRAAIVTRPDSPITSMKDLAGRTFAFGATNSTQGYLIPRLMLEQADIELKNLRSYIFTGSHSETANAVISGRIDAGGMQDTLAQTLSNRGLLRIIAWSDYYPSSGVMAGSHVPSKVVQAVTAALLEFDPQGRDNLDLYHWERTEMPRGFTPTHDVEYSGLRRWAEKYGLLSP